MLSREKLWIRRLQCIAEAIAQLLNYAHNARNVPMSLQAVARHSEDFCGLKVDWQTQTLMTAGATEALAATFLALINPGDEVSIILDFPKMFILACPLKCSIFICSFAKLSFRSGTKKDANCGWRFVCF